MKPTEQNAENKTAVRSATRKALYSSSRTRIPLLSLHSKLALLTGLLAAFALHAMWSGLTLLPLVFIGLAIYIVTYPLYLYLDQSHTGIKPSLRQLVPEMTLTVVVALTALAVYYLSM